MFRYLTSFLLLFILSWSGYGQTEESSWDDTLKTGWPPGFRIVEVRSSSDGSFQKARFYSSGVKKHAPLIVSLHTWSGDYDQYDPLAEEVLLRGWNYIHPDFRGAAIRSEACGSDLVISDIGDAIGYALRNSDADPSEVHIIGVSGGGYTALVAYMKLEYPVKSFSAWVPISDLGAWYDESKARGLKYAGDLELVTTGTTLFDSDEAIKRSPLFMKFNPDLRRNTSLKIFAGINDGYTGSVPVTHSINFYNKIIGLKYPDEPGRRVSDSIIIRLLSRGVDPEKKPELILGGRNVYLSAGAPEASLIIFEGGHEMIVPQALSLLPVEESRCDPMYKSHIMVIGDSNGTGSSSWPEQLRKLLPFSAVSNFSIPGNTIGFDNLDRQELNTLRNIDRYIAASGDISGSSTIPDVVIIGLGTNDAKKIFSGSQKAVPLNMATLIFRIREKLPEACIIVVSPPPVDQNKADETKYGGSSKRVAKLAEEFRNIALSAGVEYIDIHTLLNGRLSEVTADGIHLTPSAQFEAASYIAGRLSPASTDENETITAREKHAAIDTNVIIPPSWAFGILYGGYTDQEGTIARIKDIQAHDYPIDAYWIDSWFWSYADSGAGPAGYLDFAGDNKAYPDRKGMWSWMEENNIKGGFWVWDAIQETGNREAFRDFKEKGYFSGVYLNRNPWHNKGTTTAMFSEDMNHPGTLCGNIDFDNPKAVSYFKERLKPFFEEGADFIKLDRTDRISVCKAIYELTASEGKESMGRGLILSHSGGTDSPDYKRYPLKWTDDTRSDWNIEAPLIRFDPWVPQVALKENIAMYTNPASRTSRIPFLTNDLGGFDMGKTDRPDEELYIRWMQFSMFCPVTEVFCQPENPTSNLAWNYSSFADSLFREYSHMRMQLFPYLYSYAHISRLKGTNMIRPIPGQLYEYMLGNEILVAPVYEKGLKKRPVHLPKGRWVNYWTGEELEGGREIIIDAPVEQIPLLIRQGAIIPERLYRSSIEMGNNDTLTLNVYPGADYSWTLIEDDGLSNDYQMGEIATTEITSKVTDEGFILTINPVQGHYSGMKDSRRWILKIHSARVPQTVMVNKRPVRFEYEHERKRTLVIAGNYVKSKKTEVRVSFND